MDITAVCERSGDWWAISIPEVKGAHTQAKRLDQVPAMVRDAVSLLTGVAEDDINVTIDARVPGVGTQARIEWRLAELLEEYSRSLQDDAAVARRASLLHYKDAGLSVRDIGELTGVSHQRVSQLLNSLKDKALVSAADAVSEVKTGREVDIVAEIERMIAADRKVSEDLAELARGAHADAR